MSPITAKEALQATNPDRAAYGLAADASEDDLFAAREKAAQNIIAGVAANDAYWDSRPELEALRAQVEGHGPPPPADSTATTTAPAVAPGDATATAIESTAVEEPGAPTPQQVQAARDAAAQLPPDADPAVAKLREQLINAGITPDA